MFSTFNSKKDLISPQVNRQDLLSGVSETNEDLQEIINDIRQNQKPTNVKANNAVQQNKEANKNNLDIDINTYMSSLKIAKVITFVKENIIFLAEISKNPEEFQTWLNNNFFHDFSLLRKLTQYHPFKKALIAFAPELFFSENDDEELVKENQNLMFELLRAHSISATLLQYVDSPAIHIWYLDHYIKQFSPELYALLIPLKNSKEIIQLKSRIRDINFSELSKQAKSTAIEQAIVETYWEIRENRFLARSKTADALQKILNSPPPHGLDLPGKYGEYFRIPTDVTCCNMPMIREYKAVAKVTMDNGAEKAEEKFFRGSIPASERERLSINQIKRNFVEKVKSTIIKEYKDPQIEIQIKENDVEIEIFDISFNQNDNFNNEALKIIESRKIKEPIKNITDNIPENSDDYITDSINANYDKKHADYVNNYIKCCLDELDKDDQLDRKDQQSFSADDNIYSSNEWKKVKKPKIQKETKKNKDDEDKIRIKKFKLQLILKDLDQEVIGKQNSPILNLKDLEENKKNLPLIYATQQLRVVLARTKTQQNENFNHVLSAIDTINSKYNELSPAHKIDFRELSILFNELKAEIKRIADQARVFRKQEYQKKFPAFACFFSIYAQCNLADALEKFDKEVLSEVSFNLSQKAQQEVELIGGREIPELDDPKNNERELGEDDDSLEDNNTNNNSPSLLDF